MNLNPFAGRPPRPPLGGRWSAVVGSIVGVWFIVGGVLFITVRNIDYPPGDYRGSDAYNFLTGGAAIAVGIWVLLSIRYPRLRPPWRRRHQ